MCVQLLLGYLPPDQRQWQATLQSKRAEYARFCKVREPVFASLRETAVYDCIQTAIKVT